MTKPIETTNCVGKDNVVEATSRHGGYQEAEQKCGKEQIYEDVKNQTEAITMVYREITGSMKGAILQDADPGLLKDKNPDNSYKQMFTAAMSDATQLRKGRAMWGAILEAIADHDAQVGMHGKIREINELRSGGRMADAQALEHEIRAYEQVVQYEFNDIINCLKDGKRQPGRTNVSNICRPGDASEEWVRLEEARLHQISARYSHLLTKILQVPILVGQMEPAQELYLFEYLDTRYDLFIDDDGNKFIKSWGLTFFDSARGPVKIRRTLRYSTDFKITIKVYNTFLNALYDQINKPEKKVESLAALKIQSHAKARDLTRGKYKEGRQNSPRGAKSSGTHSVIEAPRGFADEAPFLTT